MTPKLDLPVESLFHPLINQIEFTGEIITLNQLDAINLIVPSQINVLIMWCKAN